tara:strand:- start:3199 stop:3462 length:264 start_codon:yes stop_codon:yes gene_type:complete
MKNSRGGLTPEQFILFAKYINYGDKLLHIEINTTEAILERAETDLDEYTEYLENKSALEAKVIGLTVKKESLEAQIELMKLCIGAKK